MIGVCRASAEGEKPMTSEPAAQSQPTSVRARRRARIAARIAERENYFDLLASGYSCPQIADAAKVSVATVQRAIDRAIAERRLDAPDRYMHLQVARLTKAPRLVAALDRYHGLAAAKPHWRPAPAAPLPAPAAPPLALPAPPVALTDAKT